MAGTKRGGECAVDFTFHQGVNAGNEGKALARTVTGWEVAAVWGLEGAAIIVSLGGGDRNPVDIPEDKTQRAKEGGELFAGGKGAVEIKFGQPLWIDPKAGVTLAATPAASSTHLCVEGKWFHEQDSW